MVLGAIAGFTIFLGLPLARLRTTTPRLRTFLNALSAGILLFLLFEIFHQATEPLERAVDDFDEEGLGHLLGLSVVYLAGLTAGLMSLVYGIRKGRPPSLTGAPADDPGNAGALRLGITIATGIGLHNFSEGLAIGQSAQAGQVALVKLLVVGFALHNTTEGFGIVGPLAAAGVRPSWRYLGIVGLIGGGPTFLGTVIGMPFESVYVFVGFLALAAGAIIYVVAEILNVGRRLASWHLTMWGVLIGIILGVATELVIEAA